MSGRRRRSGSEVQKLVEEFKASGLTHRAFAEVKGVPVSTVSGWLRRCRQSTTPDRPVPSLVPVVTSSRRPSESVIRIDLPNGTRVEVASSTSGKALAEIVAAVGASC